MGHKAIKVELIEWLMKLEDDETLEYLKVVKDSINSEHDWWHDLSEKDKSGIERDLKDIKDGRTTTHEDVKKRYGL